MISDARPIPDWDAFQTLSAEDMILHEMIHSTTHLYSFGLKLAVDLFRIVRLQPDAPVSWEKVAEAANATRCPNAFWAPMAALVRDLPQCVPAPPEFLALVPAARNLQRMRMVAQKRLFTATDDADKMNPFTRNGIFLLLHKGPVSRARYLVDLLSGDAAESRKTAMNGDGGQSWKRLPSHLKNALHDLQAYRRAIKQAPAESCRSQVESDPLKAI